MYDDQTHLLLPVVVFLKKSFHERLNSMIDHEIAVRGLGPYTREEYRESRLKSLKHYSDQVMLRLANELSSQLAARVVLHAPFKDGNGHVSSKLEEDEDE
jgi:hypothetical protein